jgi:hypothetical protein
VTLTELKPTSLTSVIDRDWRASLPAYVVAIAVIVPAIFCPRPYNWFLIAVAALAWVLTNRWLINFRHSRRVKESRRPPEKLPDAPPYDPNQRMSTLRALFADRAVSSYVLFSFGTFVTVSGRSDDPIAEAKSILDRYGHAIAGTPTADTLTYELLTGDFVVGGHHPSIFTFIPERLFGLTCVIRSAAAGQRTRQQCLVATFGTSIRLLSKSSTAKLPANQTLQRTGRASRSL